VLPVWCAAEGVPVAEARRAIRETPMLQKLGQAVRDSDARLYEPHEWLRIKEAIRRRRPARK
jgi:hypothetical protein